jgi:hypothetical protein
MNSDYIVIERELLKAVLDENKRLKIELEKYQEPKKDQPMEKQISIEEYTKTLKPKENKNEK